MKILVTNDDGIYATGLQTLVKALRLSKHEVYVVAPDRNCSGSGHSLTLRRPLIVNWLDQYTVAVQGTPADCVYLSMNGLLKQQPDIVISGINSGENLGDDVFYSGTFAAAAEGYQAGVFSLSVSLVGSCNFITAAAFISSFVSNLDIDSLELLNINIPDVLKDDLQGVITTKMGFRDIKSRRPIWPEKKSGEVYYQVGPPSKPYSKYLATEYDFGAVANNYISVTPIDLNITKQSRLAHDFSFDLSALEV